MITKEDKVKAIEHILYEMVQMFMCEENLSKLNGLPLKSVEEEFHYNLYLEGVLMHFRSLRDFFEHKPKSPDLRDPRSKGDCDIYSQDYGIGPVVMEFPRDLRTRLNREVSHLSYHRVLVPINNAWHQSATTSLIQPFCKEFVIKVIADYPGIENKNSDYYQKKILSDTAFACLMNLVKKFNIPESK